MRPITYQFIIVRDGEMPTHGKVTISTANFTAAMSEVENSFNTDGARVVILIGEVGTVCAFYPQSSWENFKLESEVRA